MGEGAIEDGTYSWFAVVLETVVLPYPELWTVLAVIAQVGAAVALIIGFWTRPAAFITILYFLPVFHLGPSRTSPLFTVPIVFAFVANAGRYYGVDSLLWNRQDSLGRLTRWLNAPLPISRRWYPGLAAAFAVVALYYLISIPQMSETAVDLSALELTIFAGLVAGGFSYLARGAAPTAVGADALRIFVGYRFLQEIFLRTDPGANALPGWASADAQAEVFAGLAEAHVEPMATLIEGVILPTIGFWVILFAAVQTAVGIALFVGYRTRLAGALGVGYLSVLVSLGLVRLAPLVFASAIIAATLGGQHASLDAVAGRDIVPPALPTQLSLPAGAVGIVLLWVAGLIGIDPEAGYGAVAGAVSLVMFSFGLLALALVSNPRVAAATERLSISRAAANE